MFKATWPSTVALMATMSAQIERSGTLDLSRRDCSRDTGAHAPVSSTSDVKLLCAPFFDESFTLQEFASAEC